MYLKVSDMAKILNVCNATIRSLISKGDLRAIKMTSNKQSEWRIHRAEVEIFLEKRFKEACYAIEKTEDEIHEDIKEILEPFIEKNELSGNSS